MADRDTDPEADEGAEIEVNYAQSPERARQIATLQTQIESVEQRAEQADALAKTALDLVNEKDEQIEALEAEIENLQTEVDELREANAIVARVNDNRELSVDDRAVVCVQTLANDAGSDGRAAMTIAEGWSTLGREFDRTRMYDVFKRAESLIGNNDVCWYQKEPRGHTPPSRLILDRSSGDLPDTVAGHALRRGGRR